MITIDELKAKLGGMKTAVDDLRDALSIEASEKRLAELEALGDGRQYLVDLSLTRENPSAAENFGSSNPVQLRS